MLGGCNLTHRLLWLLMVTWKVTSSILIDKPALVMKALQVQLLFRSYFFDNPAPRALSWDICLRRLRLNLEVVKCVIIIWCLFANRRWSLLKEKKRSLVTHLNCLESVTIVGVIAVLMLRRRLHVVIRLCPSKGSLGRRLRSSWPPIDLAVSEHVCSLVYWLVMRISSLFSVSSIQRWCILASFIACWDPHLTQVLIRLQGSRCCHVALLDNKLHFARLTRRHLLMLPVFYQHICGYSLPVLQHGWLNHPLRYHRC